MTNHHKPAASVFLGIDCGTSKIAVVIIDMAGQQVHVASRAHQAELPVAHGHSEQDANRIIAITEMLVQAVPVALRQRIAAIGFTGQMHGVVLHDEQGYPLSPLITWQDRRVLADPTFLSSLGQGLFPGYGMVTLAWLARAGDIPSPARAATIHGLIAATWGSLPRSAIDPTDAQAWGSLLPITGVKVELLPQLVEHGAIIGQLQETVASRLGLVAGISLLAPLGDNQASLRATMTDLVSDVALTIGTGCQLAAIVRKDQALTVINAERRPFNITHDVLVAAPLCGGAAWKWLAEMAASWMADLEQSQLTVDDMHLRLDRLGLAADDSLSFAPHLSGERYDMSLTGQLSGLRLTNGSLGQIARAVARSIVANARALMPPAALRDRTRVVASGNALRRSALLRTMAGMELGLPIIISNQQEEAATGAALVALQAVGKH